MLLLIRLELAMALLTEIAEDGYRLLEQRISLDAAAQAVAGLAATARRTAALSTPAGKRVNYVQSNPAGYTCHEGITNPPPTC